MKNEILLSLHPQYWDLIKSGKKTIEIRKSKPQTFLPFRVFVYVTGGIGVVGCFDCEQITTSSPEWFASDFCKGDTCLTLDELEEYAAGKVLYGWHVKPGSVTEYESPIELQRMGISYPPQSWRYLKKDDSE